MVDFKKADVVLAKLSGEKYSGLESKTFARFLVICSYSKLPAGLLGQKQKFIASTTKV
jgi:hypothetical protein